MSGYASTLPPTDSVTIDSSVPAAAAKKADQVPRDSLSSLQALAGFLAALTNTNRDGRIIVEASRGGSDPGSTHPGGSHIRFVLLNAATHFAEILSAAHSVVLASGTLSPIDALTQQLFPSQPPSRVHHFQCGHVIDDSSLTTLAIGRGPGGQALDFRHGSRGTHQVSRAILFKLSLARSLSAICHAMLPRQMSSMHSRTCN